MIFRGYDSATALNADPEIEGDLDSDGQVNVSDVSALLDIIAGA